MGIAWAFICKFTSFPINNQTGLADNFFCALLLSPPPSFLPDYTPVMATPIQAHRHAIFPHLLSWLLTFVRPLFVEALQESVNGTTCSHSEILYRYSDFSLQDIPAYFVESLADACSNLLWPVIQVPYFPLPLLYQHRAFLFASSLRSLCIIKFFPCLTLA